jgi:hypothetical protein
MKTVSKKPLLMLFIASLFIALVFTTSLAEAMTDTVADPAMNDDIYEAFFGDDIDDVVESEESAFEYFDISNGTPVMDDDMLSPSEIEALPSLTISRGTTTSTSVYLTGSITNAGGYTVTARGFWIRKSTETTVREILVSGTSNPFSTTITGLLPNTTYVARAIARNSSSTSTGQSDAITFTTPNSITNPGAPTSFSGTPGNAQVSLSWAAPSANGGTNLTYEVSYKLNSASTWTTLAVSTSISKTVTGLTNGSSYNFRVRARTGSSSSDYRYSSYSSTITLTPATLPSLSISRGTTTSTSVYLTGTINTTGGATITARGFWIRKSTETGTQEILVSGTSNPFSTTISGDRKSVV